MYCKQSKNKALICRIWSESTVSSTFLHYLRLRVEGGREREEGEADGEREDAMTDLASQRNEQ